MDYKIKLGHINLNIPGEVSVELKDIELEVTNFKLKDIASIVKEAKNIIKEMHDLEKMNHEAQKEAQEREYEHFMNAIAVREAQFPTHLTPLPDWTMANEPDVDEYVPQDGLDTDGDLPPRTEEAPVDKPSATIDQEDEIDFPKRGKVTKGRSKAVAGLSFRDKHEVTLGE